MKKQSSLNEKLAAVRSLADQPLTDDIKKLIINALHDKSNLMVAGAAAAVKKHGLKELIPELLSAYDRFFDNPLKTDKLCHAKLAILDALDDLGFENDDLYLVAAKYRQMEPSYGPPVDTAVKLRIRAARALLQKGYQEIFFVLADNLMDVEPEVRVAASRYLASIIDERSELLLRMKIKSGDSKPENCGEYFSALIGLNAAKSVPFVAQFLSDSNQVIAEEAAISLGESRTPEAFKLLSDLYALSPVAERRRFLLMAISLIRSDDSAMFLIDTIKDQTVDLALSAIDALRLYRDKSHIVSALKEIVAQRHAASLTAKLKQMLDEK